jgi:hypothetical protein
MHACMHYIYIDACVHNTYNLILGGFHGLQKVISRQGDPIIDDVHKPYILCLLVSTVCLFIIAMV